MDIMDIRDIKGDIVEYIGEDNGEDIREDIGEDIGEDIREDIGEDIGGNTRENIKENNRDLLNIRSFEKYCTNSTQYIKEKLKMRIVLIQVLINN